MRGVLYLASTSPRRQELLRRAGIDFVVHPPGDEPVGTGSPRERAVQRARAKASGAVVPAGEGFVLGVDTVVVVPAAGDAATPGRPTELGKPADRAAAAAMLGLLQGRTHEVVTAHCAIAVAGGAHRGPPREECIAARVRCRPLGAAAMETYLDGFDWSDKAGGYGIQGDAGAFMELVEGDLDTVIGLSVAAVRRLVGAEP